ncbi:MAG: RNA polymerase sigma factor [Acidobacteriota bacterium]
MDKDVVQNRLNIGVSTQIGEYINESMLSLSELYQTYYRKVYSVCLRMTNNVADAEDLAHDAILQAQKSLANFRGQAPFSSWLHRITVNQVLMHFRKKSYRCEIKTDNGEIPEQIDPDTSTDNTLSIINRVALIKAIRQLPPGYQRVFLLHDVEGYEHVEIALILGINAGTSKSQLHKARMHLRKTICNSRRHKAIPTQIEQCA